LYSWPHLSFTITGLPTRELRNGFGFIGIPAIVNEYGDEDEDEGDQGEKERETSDSVLFSSVELQTAECRVQTNVGFEEFVLLRLKRHL
jgi:hypothetical protein